jgi:hypothetical protein
MHASAEGLSPLLRLYGSHFVRPLLEFFVWHWSAFASAAVAERQAHWLEKTLAYDHERDQKHCDRIEL